jgi:hypothetical protein
LSYDPAKQDLVAHYWQVIMTSTITVISEPALSP